MTVERGFFGPAENTLLLIAHAEREGLLAVSPDGKSSVTDAGIAWCRARDAELDLEPMGVRDDELTTNRILVHLSFALAKSAGLQDEAMFPEVLRAMAASPEPLA